MISQRDKLLNYHIHLKMTNKKNTEHFYVSGIITYCFYIF